MLAKECDGAGGFWDHEEPSGTIIRHPFSPFNAMFRRFGDMPAADHLEIRRPGDLKAVAIRLLLEDCLSRFKRPSYQLPPREYISFWVPEMAMDRAVAGWYKKVDVEKTRQEDEEWMDARLGQIIKEITRDSD